MLNGHDRPDIAQPHSESPVYGFMAAATSFMTMAFLFLLVTWANVALVKVILSYFW